MDDASADLTPRTRKRINLRLSSQLTLPMYAASRFLKKRLSSAAELIKSSEFWLHTTPSKDCDIVVTFPPNTSEYTVMWILTRLRNQMPDLEVHLRKHNMTGVYGLYLTASWKGMYREAESLRIRKRLKAEYGGGLKEFAHQNASYYEGYEDHDNFLSSQERQTIVQHMLLSLRATEDEDLNGIKFAEGQAIIPKCLSEKVISQVFPLHNRDTLHHLTQIWVQAFFKFQPLDHICDYFGVKIAMYFAWLGHYTTALTIPGAFGFFLWIFFYGNQATEDICFVLFAFFNVIWTTLYLESWKRRQAELAYRWGTLDQANALLEEPRALFQGLCVRSSVTGRLEPHYPNWKRNIFRYCVSLPVVLTSLVLACVSIFSIFRLEHWWLNTMEALEYPSWMAYLPKIFLALVIFIMDEVYHRIALILNNLENYRSDEEYENHLTIKMGVFISAFISLFYIAFYLQNMEKLRDLLATLLITRQIMGNIKESFVPFVMGRCKLVYLHLQFFGSPATTPSAEGSPAPEFPRHTSSETLKSDRINITQAEHESNMFKYSGTFDDYLEMFIQFGYVMLFSSAFPMAATCAFLNNLIEIRSDAFKLCCSMQRPFSVRVANIGAWQIMMEIMGVIAIIVNCALIGMSGQVHRLLPHLSTTGTIVLIIVLEVFLLPEEYLHKTNHCMQSATMLESKHLLLAIKFGLAYAIPDVPAWVETEMAKVEFRRREALREMDYLRTFNIDRSSEGEGKFDEDQAEFNANDEQEVDEESDQCNIGDDFFDAEESMSSDGSHVAFSSIQICPTDLIGIPVSSLICDGTPPEHNHQQGAEENGLQPGVRQRKRNSLPSIEVLADQAQRTVASLPFLNLPKHHLKLPLGLKLGRKKSLSKESSKEPNEESSSEDEPLIRKPSRRFSLFPLGKR